MALPVLLRPKINFNPNPRWEGGTPGAPGTAGTFQSYTNSTTGGVLTTIGTGVENGYPYLDLSITGTVTVVGAIEIVLAGSTDIPVTAGQIVAFSAPIYLLSGSIGFGVQFNAATRDAGGAAIQNNLNAVQAQIGAVGPLSEAIRVIGSPAANGAGTAFVRPGLRFNLNSLSTFNATLRVGAVNVELSGGPTYAPILPPAGAPARSMILTP